MSDPYFQSLFADRIGGANYGKGTEIYKFEKIKRARRKALADHPERKLLDFGIGENDDMADEAVRAALARYSPGTRTASPGCTWPQVAAPRLATRVMPGASANPCRTA